MLEMYITESKFLCHKLSDKTEPISHFLQMNNLTATTNQRHANRYRKRRKKLKVQFKDKDEMQDVRYIETRKELSMQDQQLRWYRNSEIDAMRKIAHLVVQFISRHGLKSYAVQMGLQMEVFDLRGLELRMDVERSIEKYNARQSILKYHKKYKWDVVGLSLVSQYISANAERQASNYGHNDASVAMKLYKVISI
jgi:hypothetical protein